MGAIVISQLDTKELSNEASRKFATNMNMKGRKRNGKRTAQDTTKSISGNKALSIQSNPLLLWLYRREEPKSLLNL